MALLLSAQDVASAVTMPEAIAAVERAFLDLQTGHAQMPPRSIIVLPGDRGDCFFMPAMIPALNTWGIKVSPYVSDNPTRGLPAVSATIMLMSTDTGETLSVMEGAGLTSLRTGAATGLAVRCLVRPEAQTLGMIGLGTVAYHQIEGVCAVRPIRTVLAHSRHPERHGDLLQRVSRDLGVEVRVERDLENLCRESDVVVTATTSKEPLVRGDWLRPGTMVVTIGTLGAAAREVDTATVTRARVVCDLPSACLAEAGELRIPIAEGVWREEDVYAGLGEILTGEKEAPERDQVILFKSVGLAIEDLAVAYLAYSEAQSRGLGTSFSFL